MAEQGIVSLTPHQTEQAIHLAQLIVISLKLGEEKLRKQDAYNAFLMQILTENTNRNPAHQQEMEQAIEQERMQAGNHLDDILRQAREGILKDATWEPPKPRIRIVQDVPPPPQLPTKERHIFRGCWAQLVVVFTGLVLAMMIVSYNESIASLLALPVFIVAVVIAMGMD
jgi:Ca2+/Na+ antiporter